MTVLVLLGYPSGSSAQSKLWRVGLLSNGPLPQEARASWRDALLQVLALNGFRIGKNLELVDRYSGGYSDRLPQLAREISAARGPSRGPLAFRGRLPGSVSTE
jgi:hypothetical protein